MKRPMSLFIYDTPPGPVRDVKMAAAKERHDRLLRVQRLVNEGHCRISEDDEPAVIRVAIAGEFLADKRGLFPTVQLMARLELAIASGQSERNERPVIEDYKEDRELQFDSLFANQAARYRK